MKDTSPLTLLAHERKSILKCKPDKNHKEKSSGNKTYLSDDKLL